MLSDEEKAVLKTAKENYGLTSAEQKILVNLIEKQDKIINQQSYTNKKMRKKLKNYRKLLKLKDKTIANFEKELARLSGKNLDLFRQNEKQDKIINEMAQELIDAPIRILKGDLFKFTNKKDTIEYFSKKAGE